MKKVVVIFVFSLLSNFLFGQVEFGLRAGLSSFDMVSKGIDVVQNGELLNINYKDASYGYHFGVYGRAKLLGIFIQPSFLLNSTKLNYQLDQFSEGAIFQKVFSETYYNIDIPIVGGMKFGPARIYIGPVAHINLASSSGLRDFKNYDDKFETATYGYQAGVGLDFWKLRLDIAYEGNLKKFGDHITFGENRYSFDSAASRVLSTVSYRF